MPVDRAAELGVGNGVPIIIGRLIPLVIPPPDHAFFEYARLTAPFVELEPFIVPAVLIVCSVSVVAVVIEYVVDEERAVEIVGGGLSNAVGLLTGGI